jgi:NADPH:quinone reductase-like Zn-dependent oxidoreductase
MKAAVVRVFGQAPRHETVTLPESPDGIVVDVLASALSPRVRSGATGQHYMSSGVLPLVPGIDGVGQLPDGRRIYFLAAHDTFGTMSEKTLADPRLVVPLPDGVSAQLVAAAMIPAMSSWVALTKRVELRRGHRVLVLGATGTAGQLAIQIAKHLGAGHVMAAGRNPETLERLNALGADIVIRLTGTKSDAESVAEAACDVDIVLDYLWGAVTTTVMPALCRRRADDSRALHWVLLGSAAGDDIVLSSVLLRKRNLHVLGSGQGAVSTADMFSVAPDIVAACAAGTLRVQLREVPLADVEQQWAMAEASRERLVFIP